MYKYIFLTIGLLLFYISVVLIIVNRSQIRVNYDLNQPMIYTVYLDGEVNYNGPIELKKGTRVGEFIYPYLTKYSDYDSFSDNELISNNKLYIIGRIDKIDINTADKKTLMALDGVGDVYSNSIISNRPYKNIEELREKKIIGEALYASIKNKICC